VPAQWRCGSPRKQWLFVKSVTERLNVSDRSVERVGVRSRLEPSNSKIITIDSPGAERGRTTSRKHCHLGQLQGARAQSFKTTASRKVSRKSLLPDTPQQHARSALNAEGGVGYRQNKPHEATIRRGGSGVRSWIGGGSHYSREDSKDGIHGENFLTLLAMVA